MEIKHLSCVKKETMNDRYRMNLITGAELKCRRI